MIRGHVPAQTGQQLQRRVADVLAKHALEHAATGLGAAWLLTGFAAFRTATFFLGAEPGEAIFDQLNFRPGERGANLWLALPNDDGVFHGATERDGIACVHPVQAYLDLRGHPERSSEAADDLRAKLLNWQHDE